MSATRRRKRAHEAADKRQAIVWEGVQLRQTNVDIIASVLRERSSPGDVVVVNSWFYGVTFQHYYRGETAWITAPPIQRSGLHRYDLLKEQMAMEEPLRPVFDAMTNSFKSGNHVWLVGDLASPPAGQLPPMLPPAPKGPGGWNSGYYLSAWTLQLGHFIGSHATEGERVNVQVGQPVNPYENLSVLAFKGWRP